ncbi:MAG: ABC transporter ATP-binding protein, partial [Aeoliella sp.]
TQPAASTSTPQRRTRKLAYHEKRELESLPALIENLDADIAELTAEMASPAFFKQPPHSIASSQQHLKNLTQQLANAYEKWEELEAID